MDIIIVLYLAIGGDADALNNQDLEKYVADLIIKENNQKKKEFDKYGFQLDDSKTS